MIERVNGEAIRFLLPVTTGEIDDLLGGLSSEVLKDLSADLATSGEAHRYDLALQRAYYFRLGVGPTGIGLACWQWDGIETYGEAGRLFTAIVDLDLPLTPGLAERLYWGAKDHPPSHESGPSPTSP